MLAEYADPRSLGMLGGGSWVNFYQRVAWLSAQPLATQTAVLNELRLKAPDVLLAVREASRNLETHAKRMQGMGYMGQMDGFFDNIGRFFKKIGTEVSKGVKRIGQFVAPVVGAFSPIAGGLLAAAVEGAGGNPNIPGTTVPALMPAYNDAALALTPAVAAGNAPGDGTIGGVPTKYILLGAAAIAVIAMVSKR